MTAMYMTSAYVSAVNRYAMYVTAVYVTAVHVKTHYVTAVYNKTEVYLSELKK